jgi:hypothetical protein
MINSKITTTAALLFALLSLGGMVAIPGLSLVSTTTVYAQTSLAEDIVGGVLGDFFGDEEEAEDTGAEDDEGEAADNSQTVEQPVTQDTNQDVDQSEENEQENDNTQTQTGVIDQDIAQGIQDGHDSADSSSESGDAKADKKGSASSSSNSGDAASINNQDAANDASLQQVQVQNVDQNNFAEFGDDIADLAAVNVALPVAVPINVQEEEEVVEESDDEVPPPPEEEDAFFCIIGGPGALCFESLAECEEALPRLGGTECQRFETLPEGAALCRFEGDVIACQI